MTEVKMQDTKSKGERENNSLCSLKFVRIIHKNQRGFSKNQYGIVKMTRWDHWNVKESIVCLFKITENWVRATHETNRNMKDLKLEKTR